MKCLPLTNHSSLVQYLWERPGACTIKHYGFIIHGRWSDFVVSKCLFYCQSQNASVQTNTLAFYGIRKLRIHNVLQYRLKEPSPMWSTFHTGRLCPHLKYQTRLERLSRDGWSRLFGIIVSYEEKRFTHQLKFLCLLGGKKV